jgi:DNA-binding transcriptional LysR family regulator
MPENFGLREIQTFIRVTELASFKKAAEDLSISQPALTRRLKKLEDDLGARLLDRTTRNVSLTEVGRRFLPAARRIIIQFEESISGIRDVIDIRSGQVTIASLPTIAEHIVPKAVEIFGERHPELRVRILDTTGPNVVEHVRRGEAEFAIDMKPDDPDPDMDFDVVLEDHFVLACRRDHPLADTRPIAWDELGALPIVTLGAYSGTSRLLSARLAEARLSGSWRYEVQHFSTLMAFLETGLGLGILPGLVMQAMMTRPFIFRPLVKPTFGRTIVIVKQRGKTLSPAAKSLERILLKILTASR